MHENYDVLFIFLLFFLCLIWWLLNHYIEEIRGLLKKTKEKWRIGANKIKKILFEHPEEIRARVDKFMLFVLAFAAIIYFIMILLFGWKPLLYPLYAVGAPIFSVIFCYLVVLLLRLFRPTNTK